MQKVCLILIFFTISSYSNPNDFNFRVGNTTIKGGVGAVWDYMETMNNKTSPQEVAEFRQKFIQETIRLGGTKEIALNNLEFSAQRIDKPELVKKIFPEGFQKAITDAKAEANPKENFNFKVGNATIKGGVGAIWDFMEKIDVNKMSKAEFAEFKEKFIQETIRMGGTREIALSNLEFSAKRIDRPELIKHFFPEGTPPKSKGQAQESTRIGRVLSGLKSGFGGKTITEFVKRAGRK